MEISTNSWKKHGRSKKTDNWSQLSEKWSQLSELTTNFRRFLIIFSFIFLQFCLYSQKRSCALSDVAKESCAPSASRTDLHLKIMWGLTCNHSNWKVLLQKKSAYEPLKIEAELDSRGDEDKKLKWKVLLSHDTGEIVNFCHFLADPAYFTSSLFHISESKILPTTIMPHLRSKFIFTNFDHDHFCKNERPFFVFFSKIMVKITIYCQNCGRSHSFWVEIHDLWSNFTIYGQNLRFMVKKKRPKVWATILKLRSAFQTWSVKKHWQLVTIEWKLVTIEWKLVTTEWKLVTIEWKLITIEWIDHKFEKIFD